MKVKVTKKQIKNNYANIVCVGYCGLSQILRYFTPNYYTCGVYGWNADVYDFGSFAICTGYRPFGNIDLTFEEEEHLNKMQFNGTREEREQQALYFLKSYFANKF